MPPFLLLQGTSRAVNARIGYLTYTLSGLLHFTTEDSFIALYDMACPWNTFINEIVQALMTTLYNAKNFVTLGEYRVPYR